MNIVHNKMVVYFVITGQLKFGKMKFGEMNGHWRIVGLLSSTIYLVHTHPQPLFANSIKRFFSLRKLKNVKYF